MSVRALKTFQGHADKFKQAFEKAMMEISQHPDHQHGFNFLASNPRDLDSLVDGLRKKYTEAEKEKLDSTWETFDANKDGCLSEEENLALTKNYFECMKGWFPELMGDIFKASMGFLQDPRATQAFEMMHDSMQPFYQEYFEDVSCWTAGFSAEMWEMMDVNHDGKVTKEEFMSTWVQCSDDIVAQITKRTLYTVLGMGFIDFGQFIAEASNEAQAEDKDEDRNEAEDKEMEQLLAFQFNTAVKDLAVAESRGEAPCNIDEFWTKVCMSIRQWFDHMKALEAQGHDPIVAARGFLNQGPATLGAGAAPGVYPGAFPMSQPLPEFPFGQQVFASGSFLPTTLGSSMFAPTTTSFLPSAAPSFQLGDTVLSAGAPTLSSSVSFPASLSTYASAPQQSFFQSPTLTSSLPLSVGTQAPLASFGSSTVFSSGVASMGFGSSGLQMPLSGTVMSSALPAASSWGGTYSAAPLTLQPSTSFPSGLSGTFW